MILLLALWVLSTPPHLGTPVTVQQPDGRWKCSAACLTDGNRDGGSCRTPVVAHDKPNPDACVADLEAQCAKTKPPPGGCHWDGNRPAGK